MTQDAKMQGKMQAKLYVEWRSAKDFQDGWDNGKAGLAPDIERSREYLAGYIAGQKTRKAGQS